MKRKDIVVGWKGVLTGKGTCCQARDLISVPKSTRWKELTPKSCFLTTTTTPMGTAAQPPTHMKLKQTNKKYLCKGRGTHI